MFSHVPVSNGMGYQYGPLLVGLFESLRVFERIARTKDYYIAALVGSSLTENQGGYDLCVTFLIPALNKRL